MTLKELQAKYPTFPVKYKPLKNCPVCNGEGEFVNGKGHEHPCACVCIGGPDVVREIMVTTLQDTVSGLIDNLKQKVEEGK